MCLCIVYVFKPPTRDKISQRVVKWEAFTIIISRQNKLSRKLISFKSYTWTVYQTHLHNCKLFQQKKSDHLNIENKTGSLVKFLNQDGMCAYAECGVVERAPCFRFPPVSLLPSRIANLDAQLYKVPWENTMIIYYIFFESTYTFTNIRNKILTYKAIKNKKCHNYFFSISIL